MTRDREKCECWDSSHAEHIGKTQCESAPETVVYRVDIYDRTGLAMCEECASDALESGLFTEDAEASYA